MKRLLGVLLGLAVAGAGFWWALRNTSWEELGDRFAGGNYLTLPVMLLCLAGFYWLKAIRWSYLLRPIRPMPSSSLLSPLLIGFAANNLLPAHLGEFVRVYVLRQRDGLPAPAVLSTVVLERVFDLLAILALFAVGISMSREIPDQYVTAAWIITGGCVGAVICAVIYLVFTNACIAFATFVLRRLLRLPEGLSAKVLNLMTTAGDGLKSIRSAGAVAVIAATSIAQWALNGLIAWLSLVTFRSETGIAGGLVVTGVTALAVMIPGPPGYFGLIQSAFLLAIGAISSNPDENTVFAASMYYHMSMYIPVTALGLYCLTTLGMSFRKIQEAREQEQSAGETESDATAQLPEDQVPPTPK